MTEIFYDRYGKEHIPDDPELVTERSGIFAVFLHEPENLILMSWPVYADKSAELPGGGIEDGETPPQALIREVYEETGLTLMNVHTEERYVQNVNQYAEDLHSFWRYTQRFDLLNTANYDGIVFDGARTTPENGKAAWIPLSGLTPETCHAMHYRALQKMGIL